MDYWIIQDILHCKTITLIPIAEKPMISSTTGTFDATGQSTCSATSDNGENVYLKLIIIVSVLELIVIIGLVVYINY